LKSEAAEQNFRYRAGKCGTKVMPDSWNPQVYRERARQWREAAEKLPPGETRKVHVTLAEGYENLARLIEVDTDPGRVMAGGSLAAHGAHSSSDGVI
jgi:hypothetical protein